MLEPNQLLSSPIKNKRELTPSFETPKNPIPNQIRNESPIKNSNSSNHNSSNSSNTITNINPLSKSKDSNLNHNNFNQNLFLAVEYNDLEKASKILFQDKSQLNTLNEEGLSPLHIAVIKANLKMIDLLLQNGANPNILTNKKNQTPLHLAYLNQNSLTEEILQELLNYNAQENLLDSKNKKPIDYMNGNYFRKKQDENKLTNENSNVNNNVNSDNTVTVVTIDNHLDSFMTTNKEEDNKSRNSINTNNNINNNNIMNNSIEIIQTPKKNECENNNNFNYIYEVNKPHCRRQYTFGKEEDYIKLKNSNIDNMNSNTNINNINKNNNNVEEITQKLCVSIDTISNDKDDLNDSLEAEFNDNKDNTENNLNKGLISNSILSYTESVNNNCSSNQSKISKENINVYSNNINDIYDNEIELKIPQLENNNIKKESNDNNLNIDDLYKKLIIKKRDSLIKSHRSCISGVSGNRGKRNIEINITNDNSINNNTYNKFNIYNNNNDDEKDNINNNSNNTNNTNKTVIHNSKENSLRNATIIHNNNGFYETCRENNFYKNNTIEGTYSVFSTKSQTKNKNHQKVSNNKTSKITEFNYLENKENNDNNFYYDNNLSNNNSFDSNNNNDIENIINENNFNSNFNDNSINNKLNNNILKLWLTDIELQNYYPNFMNKPYNNIPNLINRMKNFQTKLKYDDFELPLKIRKPGHIYRILCKLEIDANLIDNKIVKFMLKNYKPFNINDKNYFNNDNIAGGNNIKLMMSEDYHCLGCCKSDKCYKSINKNDLRSFLKRYGLMNFYQNFYHNGFEIIEYVILQMYGSYPINDEILENCLHVYDEADRNKILKVIVREMKKINDFLTSDEYSENIHKDLINYENVFFEGDDEDDGKISIRFENSNNNCLII